MKKSADAWIDAREASRLLGVTRGTLYSYVSRGLVRSQAFDGSSRLRRYAREDVERLRRRAAERHAPDKVAEHAMQWGLPVLESAITLVADDALYYRGVNAVTLSRTASVRDVASLIWGAQSAAAFDLRVDGHTRRSARATEPSFIARAQAELALESLRDDAAYDLRPVAVMRTGWRIMSRLVSIAVADRPSGTVRGGDASAIDASLAFAWGLDERAAAVIRAALILCADHELNVSAFTARCVASAGSNPYAVVIAALSALEGPRHGGSTVRVESMLSALRNAVTPGQARAALAEKLRVGETLEGFGHPLYPRGDPRAAALLEMLGERYSKSPELAHVRRLARAGRDLSREEPNLDFALGAVSRVLELPSGSGLVLFAVGRTVGWVGHAIEQYATGQLIRPRAKYVGELPQTSA